MQARRIALLDVNKQALYALPLDFQSPECKLEINASLSDTAFKEEACLQSRNKVDGLIHAAGVLRDAVFLKQTATSFKEVLAGKVCNASRPTAKCFTKHGALDSKMCWLWLLIASFLK